MKNIDSLKNTSQFREVYENGRSCANSLLVLYTLKNDSDSRKLGISVSKKTGNSVVRHRITRLIRESFIMLKDEMPAGCSYVVIARPKAAGKSFSDIYNALLSLAARSAKKQL